MQDEFFLQLVVHIFPSLIIVAAGSSQQQSSDMRFSNNVGNGATLHLNMFQTTAGGAASFQSCNRMDQEAKKNYIKNIFFLPVRVYIYTSTKGRQLLCNVKNECETFFCFALS